MAIKHKVTIENGIGKVKIVNGKYNVVSNIPGYDNDSLSPKSVEIVDNIETYVFTVSASGTLRIHVTDNVNNISNAKFIRCDEQGNSLGIEVETNTEGYATFNNVPFNEEKSLKVYFKQITSDGKHTFSEEVKEIELKKNEEIIEIINPEAPLKKFTINDTNYASVSLTDGDLTLEDNN